MGLRTWESHVAHDITLSALHRGHALEHELAANEIHGGEESKNANGIAIFTGHAIVIVQAHLLAILFDPALGGYAAEDNNGEKLAKVYKKNLLLLNDEKK